MIEKFAIIALVGCGRLSFDELQDRTADAGIADAASAPNRMFMTSGVWYSDLGGVAGADAKCQAAADAEGLGGEFIALLWNGASEPSSRLAGARGWIDLTGRPIADLASDLESGAAINPLRVDEHGGTLASQRAWFGSSGGACLDWSVPTADFSVTFGTDSVISTASSVIVQCNNMMAHLVCAEHARSAVVTPAVAVGRLAFLAEFYTPSGGLAAADARCNADATAAGLPGTYLAWLGTSAGGPETRFSDGLPWRRVDGVLLAASALDFLSTGAPTYLDSFLNRTALGSISTQLTFTGVNGNTCNDWIGGSGGVYVAVPGSVLREDFRLTPFAAPCTNARSIVCLQQ